MNEALNEKTILVTGAARRVGRLLALACGRAGADVILHHGHSPEQALEVQMEIESFGRRAWILPSDLSRPDEISGLISRANDISPLYGLVNSAAIFESLSWEETTLTDWNRHLDINLTAPFLLSQAFAKQIPATADGGRTLTADEIVAGWKPMLSERKSGWGTYSARYGGLLPPPETPAPTQSP